MRRTNPGRTGPGALELIEEAVHLLRLSPLPVLAGYYLGSLPFVLGFLYFWADMSRGSIAQGHCASSAFGVALLFLWMKTWQSVFARSLKAQVTGRSAPVLTVSRFARAALVQTILQASGLFLLPMSLLIVAPFAWVYAFYQNVTAFAAEDGAEAKLVCKKALKQAQLWPRQNFLVLGTLLLFGTVVFLDAAIGLAQIPSLLKMFFGIETAFTRSGSSYFNTTFLATICGLTYLCLDPLLKAVYLLRCFYGESLHTGEDLKAELKSFAPSARAATSLLILLIGAVSGSAGTLVESARGLAHVFNGVRPSSGAETQGEPVAFGETDPLERADVAAAEDGRTPLNTYGVAQSKTPAPSQTPTPDRRPPDSRISAAELDRAIDRVLEQREFNWRLPREKRVQDSSQKGILAGFVDGVADTIRSWGRAAARWLKAAVVWLTDVIDWLREKIFGKGKIGRPESRTGTAWITSLQILVFVLVALVASIAAVLIYRMWRQRGRRIEVSSEAVAAVPDVADENVVANQLPEEDWLKLARELMGRGELRLAVRALYLASLAHLAQRDMISVAMFKSNRDYELELRRRARALPDLQAAFAENVGIFDRVWYGLHEVTEERLQRFQFNLERIKAC